MAQQKIDPSVQHPLYPELVRKAELCEDAFTGDVTEYVQRIKGMTEAKFHEYVSRAAYFGVVERTTQAIVGSMMRKPFKVSVDGYFPQSDFNTPDAFLQTCLRDLLLGARIGILVDVDEDGMSKLVTYDADDIINWSDDRFVMIKECTMQPSPENPYAHVVVETWRELYYSENGTYASRRWSKNRKGQFIAEDLPQMLVNGNPLTEIPLYVVTPYDNTWDVYTPPLFVQSGLNIQHFKQAVDLAHYARHMALPTFTISGELYTYTDANGNQVQATVNLGSTEEALHLIAGSKAEYVEVSGTSFKMLQDELKNIEDRMYLSAGRLLTHKNGVESVAALSLRQGADSAVLETMTNALEAALNGAFTICSQIDRIGTVAQIQLNDDFTTASTDPVMVKALLDAYIAGAITLEQFLNNLVESNVIPAETVQEPTEEGDPFADDEEDQGTDTPGVKKTVISPPEPAN